MFWYEVSVVERDWGIHALTMKYSWVPVMALALPLVGCFTAKGPASGQTQAPPAKSVVYLYRPYSLPGVALLVPVHCGDDSVALKLGDYHKFIVNPGPLDCRATTAGNPTVDIDAQAGRAYFIRQSISAWLIVAHTQLVLRSAEEAQAEIEKCNEQ
jgi:hypothetical protein